MEMIRTLLVDDSLEFLEAAQRFLASDPRVEVVGLSRSGQEAISQVNLANPDLVLMDLTMPEMNGLEATRQIKALSNPPQIILCALYDNPEYRSASKAVRADGFIPKSEFGEQLLPLIQLLFEDWVVAERQN